jgi:hypothetical protein
MFDKERVEVIISDINSYLRKLEEWKMSKVLS